MMKKRESSGSIIISGQLVTNFSHRKSGVVHQSSIDLSSLSPSAGPKRSESNLSDKVQRLSVGKKVMTPKTSSSKNIVKSTFSTLSKFYIESQEKANNAKEDVEDNPFSRQEGPAIKDEQQNSPQSNSVAKDEHSISPFSDKAITNEEIKDEPRKQLSYSSIEEEVDSIQIAKLSRAKPVKRRLKKAITPQIEEQKGLGPKITLKETKAPDPFEDSHYKTEAELNGIIASTSSPENPLYHLRQSGIDTPAISKAYRHFVISLFESVLFVQKMNPINEEIVLKQRRTLSRPQNLKCKLIVYQY